MSDDHPHHPQPDAPRRNFLVEAAAVVIGGIIGLVPLVVGLTVYLDPLTRRKSKADGSESNGSESNGSGSASDGEFLPITTLDAIPTDGSPKAFPVVADRINAWTKTLNERIGAVYLRRPKGDREVMALHTICPHLGCFVGHDEENQQFYCPCHASSFTLDGEKAAAPGLKNPSPRPMDTLEVKVTDDDQVLVRFVNFKTAIHEKVAK